MYAYISEATYHPDIILIVHVKSIRVKHSLFWLWLPSTSHTELIHSLIAVCNQYQFRLYNINLYNAHRFFFIILLKRNPLMMFLRMTCRTRWRLWMKRRMWEECIISQTSFRTTDSPQKSCVGLGYVSHTWMILHHPSSRFYCALKAVHVNKLCCQPTQFQNTIACTAVLCIVLKTVP